MHTTPVDADTSRPTATPAQTDGSAESSVSDDREVQRLRLILEGQLPAAAPRDSTAIEMDNDPLNRRFRGVTRHGLIDFDVPYISEVGDNLWMGGVDDGLVLPDFIDHLVRLYQDQEYVGLQHLRTHLSITMLDSVDATLDSVDATAAWVNSARQSGTTLVHCQAGLNRSALVVARALMLGPEHLSAHEAITHLRETRSPAVLCNPAFEHWLLQQDCASASEVTP